MILALWAPERAGAQIMASEEATLSQTIDGTVVTMTYSRPSRRGRDPLFGGVVFWHRWTPGANWATTLEVSKDVSLEGVPVPAGKYSVWIDISEAPSWQMVLDPEHRLFHTAPPDDNDAQIRFPVTVGSGPEMETLLWYVERVRSDGGELRMHWGTTLVAMDLRVQPSRRYTVTPEEAAPVVGFWSVRWVMPEGEEAPETTWVVQHDPATGRLTVQMDDLPASADGGTPGMYLVPGAPLVFAMAWGMNGEIWEVAGGWAEFEADERGMATSFDLRDPETDQLWGRGHRSGG